jgi:hypothetical protein
MITVNLLGKSGSICHKFYVIDLSRSQKLFKFLPLTLTLSLKGRGDSLGFLFHSYCSMILLLNGSTFLAIYFFFISPPLRGGDRGEGEIKE